MVNIDRDLLIEREKLWVGKKNEVLLRYWKKKYGSNQIKIDATIESCLENGLLNEIYDINKSVTQSLRATTGRDFENCIEMMFMKYKIPYSRQVCIGHNGIVCKTKNKGHTADFVIPCIEIGEAISKHYIISAKTTVRERFRQDISYDNLVVISLDKVDHPRVWSVQVSPTSRQFTKFIYKMLLHLHSPSQRN